jgi:phosphotransferase system HPr (HPr) family protein
MSGPLRQTVLIRNPQGFHMRPKAAFVRQAGQFQSEVKLDWNGQTFNGKSMFDLMLLAAEQGQQVTVETDGPDAADALATLVAVFDQFEEEEAPGQEPSHVPNP